MRSCIHFRTQYNHELKKEKMSMKSGSGTIDQYQSSAYWFNEMEFLKKFMKTRSGSSNFELVFITKNNYYILMIIITFFLCRMKIEHQRVKR